MYEHLTYLNLGRNFYLTICILDTVFGSKMRLYSYLIGEVQEFTATELCYVLFFTNMDLIIVTERAGALNLSY